MLRRPTRKLIALAIVSFWLIMMALFVRREGLLPFQGSSARAVSARDLRPADTWMGIYVTGGRRIGFVNTNAMPDTRGGQIGMAYTLTAKFQLALLMMPTDILLSGSAWMPQDGASAEFDFKVRSGGHAMRVSADIRDGLLKGTIHTGGEEIPLEVPVGKELLLSGAMGTTTLNVPDLRPGEEVLLDAFDPLTLSVGKARIKCIGEETIEVAGAEVKTKVITTSLGGVTSKAWVTDSEEIVRAETPFGFSMRKITAQEALASTGAGESTDLLRTVAVEPAGKRPFRGARRMTIRIGGVQPGHYPPVDETQTASGNEYTIVQSAEPTSAPPADAALDPDLASDAFVQADHPRIKEVAAQIVGNETDAWKKAVRVYDWVFRNIRKTPVFSIPSALEVLESREGDCNEHTVLFTALARAAGVPARIAIGLVWSNELNGFYYHAWPEVHVGRWIWMEPTLGQPIADATHIKLVNGNIETWPQIIPYVGQLQIEVLSIE